MLLDITLQQSTAAWFFQFIETVKTWIMYGKNENYFLINWIPLQDHSGDNIEIYSPTFLKGAVSSGNRRILHDALFVYCLYIVRISFGKRQINNSRNTKNVFMYISHDCSDIGLRPYLLS